MAKNKKNRKTFYNDWEEVPREVYEEAPEDDGESSAIANVSNSEAPTDNNKAPAKMGESFAAMFASPVIRVIVGSAKKEYNLHEGVLVQTTPYFASLLRSGLQEAQSRSVELSTEVDREDAFEKYIHYIYQQDYTAEGDVEDVCILHARVYTLAERLCIEKLKQLSAQKLQGLLSSRYKPKPRDDWGFATAKAATQPLIPAETLVQLASIIYNHTPGVLQGVGENIPLESSASGSSDNNDSSAVGRRIISGFAASCWSLFRSDKKVRSFMEETTDFAYDVLFNTGDGQPLK